MARVLLRLVGRGAGAGAAAGLLAGVASYVFGEPAVERAIDLEEAAAGDGAGVEVFSRSAQVAGLFVTSVLTGLAIGVLFAVVYAVRFRAEPTRDAWQRSVTLAAAGFVAVSLIPFLRYPGNPPAVGDPGSLGSRSSSYLAAMLIGIIAVAFADLVARRLATRSSPPPVRHLAAAAVVAVGTGAVWLLPANPDTITVPVELIWEFRLASIASLAVLWLGLGAVFGILGHVSSSKGLRDAPVAG